MSYHLQPQFKYQKNVKTGNIISSKLIICVSLTNAKTIQKNKIDISDIDASLITRRRENPIV